jgi:hypothetical protein
VEPDVEPDDDATGDPPTDPALPVIVLPLPPRPPDRERNF